MMNGQVKHFPLFGAKLLESLRGGIGFIRNLEPLDWWFGVIRGFGLLPTGGGNGSSLTANPVDHPSSSDHADERRFARDFWIEAWRRFPYLDEDLLRSIFSLGGVEAELADDAPYEVSESVDHLVHRSFFLESDTFEDVVCIRH
jgi:hypothetical protein